MTTKPATPLPGKIVSERANEGMGAPVESEVRGENRQVAVRLGRLYNDSQKEDAAYIVAACNAYPELVAALRGLMVEFVGDRNAENCLGGAGVAADQARAILAKLGEGA